MRFIFLAGDKEVFNLRAIDSKEFAESLGLIQTPVIRFVKPDALVSAEN